jgi:signal transduction histidine kinase
MNAKANILVVDDEIGPRESLRIILSPYYNVYTADGGQESLDLLGQVSIDLATVDLKMPGLSGIQVLEKIKKHNQDIEAIILTGYGSMDTAVEGLRLGAFDYIAKPFDVDHIRSLVKRALERRRAKRELKEIKSNFMANVSHEIRTPLSVVIGFVSLLLDQDSEKLTQEQRKYIEKIYRNSEELLILIDNVLSLTSLNAGDVTLVAEEFDVGIMMRESTRRFEKALEEKETRLNMHGVESQLRIVSDQLKVVRIFQNLFHNAFKFTRQGDITVQASPSPQEGYVDVEIIDTGIGIDEGQIENIFEPFQRLGGSLNQQFSGLGLGLTVARRLTELLGGTLQITSQVGMGTRVLLTIPCQLDTPPKSFQK